MLFSLKGWDNVARGNAPGTGEVILDRLKACDTLGTLSQAFSLEDNGHRDPGRCPGLCCPSLSG